MKLNGLGVYWVFERSNTKEGLKSGIRIWKFLLDDGCEPGWFRIIGVFNERLVEVGKGVFMPRAAVRMGRWTSWFGWWRGWVSQRLSVIWCEVYRAIRRVSWLGGFSVGSSGRKIKAIRSGFSPDWCRRRLLWMWTSQIRSDSGL